MEIDSKSGLAREAHAVADRFPTELDSMKRTEKYLPPINTDEFP